MRLSIDNNLPGGGEERAELVPFGEADALTANNNPGSVIIRAWGTQLEETYSASIPLKIGGLNRMQPAKYHEIPPSDDGISWLIQRVYAISL